MALGPLGAVGIAAGMARIARIGWMGLGQPGFVETVAGALFARASLPAKARRDALHIAVATLGGMDDLLTWNCAHIANPAFRPKIDAVIRLLGYQLPIICTPLELLEV